MSGFSYVGLLRRVVSVVVVDDYYLVVGEETGGFDCGIFVAVGGVDGIVLDILTVQAPDGSFGGLCGVGVSYYASEFSDGIFAFENGHDDRAGCHEIDQRREERFAAVHVIEFFGLVSRQAHIFHRTDLETLADQVVDDLARISCTYGIGLDDCKSTVVHISCFYRWPAGRCIAGGTAVKFRIYIRPIMRRMRISGVL